MSNKTRNFVITFGIFTGFGMLMWLISSSSHGKVDILTASSAGFQVILFIIAVMALDLKIDDDMPKSRIMVFTTCIIGLSVLAVFCLIDNWQGTLLISSMLLLSALASAGALATQRPPRRSAPRYSDDTRVDDSVGIDIFDPNPAS